MGYNLGVKLSFYDSIQIKSIMAVNGYLIKKSIEYQQKYSQPKMLSTDQKQLASNHGFPGCQIKKPSNKSSYTKKRL